MGCQQKKKQKHFTNSSKMTLIKNPTKKLNKKIQMQFQKPSKTTKTHFHKFSMNPTTKNNKKVQHPYRLYM